MLACSSASASDLLPLAQGIRRRRDRTIAAVEGVRAGEQPAQSCSSRPTPGHRDPVGSGESQTHETDPSAADLGLGLRHCRRRSGGCARSSASRGRLCGTGHGLPRSIASWNTSFTANVHCSTVDVCLAVSIARCEYSEQAAAFVFQFDLQIP